MGVKAVYKKGALRPLKPLKLKEGQRVEIELKESVVSKTFSISKVSDDIIEEIIESTESGE
jgi:predicted DNA-binding antitoxin AbrB/MazE fold protein